MPIEISAHVEGLEQLFRKLDHMAAVEVLKPPMEASLLDLVDFMEDYPPPPLRPYPKMLKTATAARWSSFRNNWSSPSTWALSSIGI